jgi:sugar lactone lactonase YvrE
MPRRLLPPLRPPSWAARLLCGVLLLGGASRLAAQVTAPLFTTQPASKTVNAGAAVTFSIVTTGTPPTYQWLVNGNPISGATGTSYAIASVQPANGGIYTVTATNSAGSATSVNATLLVYSPYIVTTLAGQAGSSGSANGTGAGATFAFPQGVAIDSAGNAYVSDTANHVIRKIAPGGGVTTLAGQAGNSGTLDGTGAAAQFDGPTGIAVDSAGNVYVADTYNSTIRKISPAGVVSTLAGLAPTAGAPAPENQGSANGTGAAARFQTPRGVAVDGGGNVYVADTQNSTIRKITPAGVVTTFAGSAGTTNSTDGTGAAARFNYPFGIAADAAGDLWVADTSNSTIRAITPAGVVTTLAGLAGNTGNVGGPGAGARFSLPTGIAADIHGNLFVADENNSILREITPDGSVATLAGLAGNPGSVDAAGSTARLNNPFGVAVDASGTVYVADTENSTVRSAVPQSPTFVAPAIATQPVSQTVTVGATINFSVVAGGTPTPTYQWQKNSVPIAGATGATLGLATVQTTDAASYTVIVTNPLGSVTSAAAVLTVLSAPVVPVGAQSQTVTAGTAVVLSANASGGSLTYQWQFNGAAIAGATGSTYTLSPIGTNQEGVYSVVVTNALGSTTATVGTVTVTANAHLVNLSARASAGAGANALTAGFLSSGGSKSILVRGIGPALAAFSVTGFLPDPALTLFNGTSAVIGANTKWGGSAALIQVFTQTGAFALAPTSADSALVQTIAAGAYSAQVASVSGVTGIALAEIYDADTGTPAAHLINVSARANTGAGAQLLTAGFTISGTTSETVLIRAIGPTLLSSYGVTGALALPSLSIFASGASTAMAANTVWGGTAALKAAFTFVGAFPLAATSNDSALILTLPPGAYTAQVSGVGGTTGVALVEVYDLPAH